MLTHFIDPNMIEIDSGFETLSKKIKRAMDLVGEDGYAQFKKRFIKPSLPANILAEIQNDFENNVDLSNNDFICEIRVTSLISSLVTTSSPILATHSELF